MVEVDYALPLCFVHSFIIYIANRKEIKVCCLQNESHLNKRGLNMFSATVLIYIVYIGKLIDFGSR